MTIQNGDFVYHQEWTTLGYPIGLKRNVCCGIVERIDLIDDHLMALIHNHTPGKSYTAYRKIGECIPMLRFGARENMDWESIRKDA